MPIEQHVSTLAVTLAVLLPTTLQAAGDDGEYFLARDAVPLPDAVSSDWPILVDLDDDGDLDFVIAPATRPVPGEPFEKGRVLAMTNDGTGNFSPAPARFLSTSLTIHDARDWAVEDLDGDGRKDVVLASTGTDGILNPEPGEQSRILLRRSQGGLRDMTKKKKFPKENGYVHSMAAGDVDADGDIDLYLGHIGNPDCPTCTANGWLYVNDGKARFRRTQEPFDWDQLAQDFGSSNLAFWAAHLVDADADGDLDLLLGPADDPGYAPPQDALMLNDGTGNFRLAPSKFYPKRPRAADGAGLVATPFTSADLNCDGREEIVLGYDFQADQSFEEPGVVRIWRAKKDKLVDVTKKMLKRLERRENAWIFIEDFNGDGWPDLFIPSSFRSSLWISKKGKKFVDAGELHPSFAGEFYRWAAGDLDGDGDTDLLSILDNGTTVQVFENVAPYRPSRKTCRR